MLWTKNNHSCSLPAPHQPYLLGIKLQVHISHRDQLLYMAILLSFREYTMAIVNAVVARRRLWLAMRIRMHH